MNPYPIISYLKDYYLAEKLEGFRQIFFTNPKNRNKQLVIVIDGSGSTAYIKQEGLIREQDTLETVDQVKELKKWLEE